MKNQSIAVIDSGVGGITILNKLVKNFPNERFIYYGDNDNAPYGNLSKENLLRFAIKSIDVVKHYNIKAIVLACNTLSVNLFKDIKEYSSLPTFCIFPPVEFCKVSKEKTLLLATERTAKNYKSRENFDSVGLKDLALIIEKNIFNLDAFNFNEYLNYIIKTNNLKDYYDNVILGCTHYNFIKNKFFVHFRPQRFLDGTENLLKKLEEFCQISKTLVKYNEFTPLFIGKNASINKYIYNVSGQNI